MKFLSKTASYGYQNRIIGFMFLLFRFMTICRSQEGFDISSSFLLQLFLFVKQTVNMLRSAPSALQLHCLPKPIFGMQGTSGLI